jgi:hypothetical protein
MVFNGAKPAELFATQAAGTILHIGFPLSEIDRPIVSWEHDTAQTMALF